MFNYNIQAYITGYILTEINAKRKIVTTSKARVYNQVITCKVNTTNKLIVFLPFYANNDTYLCKE